MKVELDVTMADGKTHKVIADGRDYAKMEVQGFPEEAQLTKVRFLAWSTMHRQQLTTVPFARFNETDCVDAETIADPDEAEDEQGLDPGRPEASGTSA